MNDSKDSLGDRMKLYEGVPRTRLIPKVPIMIRVDGKAFHSLSRGMNKPFDQRFVQCMWDAAVHMCKNIQGAKMGYVQSDEISVFAIDYQSDNAQGWFDYDLLKMTSVAASLATGAFCKSFWKLFPESDAVPAFDARVWSLPQHEVQNAFIWRQQDAVRNSISALAQANFSHKQLHGVNSGQMQEMLFTEKCINWNDCPTVQKRGAAVIKRYSHRDAVNPKTGVAVSAMRSEWVIDMETPTFTQDRDFIQNLVESTMDELCEAKDNC